MDSPVTTTINVELTTSSEDNTNSCLLALSVWIYALTLSVPPLLGWGSYGPQSENISCSVSWETHDPTTHIESYIAYLFAFGFFIPILVIGGSYGSIVLTLRATRRRVGSKRGHEIRVTKMVALMILAFLSAWTPYAIVSLGSQYFNMKLSPEVTIVPTILAKSSICYNPIVYAGLNTQFFRSVRSILRIKERRPQEPRAQEELRELRH